MGEKRGRPMKSDGKAGNKNGSTSRTAFLTALRFWT